MAYIPEIYQGPATTATSSETAKSKTLGQDDFLTLLVAQLQNQDPLNPSDPTEFTAQLAQFSELEQLFNLNDSMTSLATAQNNAEKLSALSLIGTEVLVGSSTFTLEQGPVEIGYSVEGVAENITLLIRDSSGRTVGTLAASELDEGNHFISWSGLDTSGQALPPGKYSIVVQAQSGSKKASVAVNPLVHARVTGVDLSSTSATLVTDAGKFDVSKIMGVYKPSQQTADTEKETEDEPASMQSAEETAVEAAATSLVDEAVQAAAAELNQPST